MKPAPKAAASAPSQSPEVKLPSGKSLRIQLAGFTEGKELYKTFLREARGQGLVLEGKTELDLSLAKELICLVFGSDDIERAVWACMPGCLYNKLPITEETFGPEDARQDYFDVLMEVGGANIRPFMKGLWQKYGAVLQLAKAAFLQSLQQRTTSSSTSDSPAPATAADARAG